MRPNLKGGMPKRGVDHTWMPIWHDQKREARPVGVGDDVKEL